MINYKFKFEIEKFRSLAMREATYIDEIMIGIYDSRPWLVDKLVHVLTVRDSFIQVVYDISQEYGRFLLYNEDLGYLSYLGESVQEAVNLYNFSDLTSEKLIDDETGLVGTLNVI